MWPRGFPKNRCPLSFNPKPFYGCVFVPSVVPYVSDPHMDWEPPCVPPRDRCVQDKKIHRSLIAHCSKGYTVYTFSNYDYYVKTCRTPSYMKPTSQDRRLTVDNETDVILVEHETEVTRKRERERHPYHNTGTKSGHANVRREKPKPEADYTVANIYFQQYLPATRQSQTDL